MNQESGNELIFFDGIIPEKPLSARLVSMPEDEYHNDPCNSPSLSASMCKTLIDKTPLDAYLQHPKLGMYEIEEEKEDESKFDLGSAAHAYLLEGVNKMAVCKHDDWRTKEAKADKKAAREDGKYPLLQSQYDNVIHMAGAAKEYIKRNKDFKYSLQDGMAEQVIICDEDTPFPRRGRLDWLSNDFTQILDYKTTKIGLRYDLLIRQIENMFYDVQNCFYIDLVKELKKTKRPIRFTFLFQNEKPPYLCQMVSLSEAMLFTGREKMNYAKNLWEYCLSNNSWPGYVDRILCLEPSSWAQAKWDERMELEGMTRQEDSGFSDPEYVANEAVNPTVNGKEKPLNEWLGA